MYTNPSGPNERSMGWLSQLRSGVLPFPSNPWVPSPIQVPISPERGPRGWPAVDEHPAATAMTNRSDDLIWPSSRRGETRTPPRFLSNGRFCFGLVSRFFGLEAPVSDLQPTR